MASFRSLPMQGSIGAARPCSRPLRMATLSAIKRTTEKNVVCIKMLKIRAGSEKAVLRLCHEVTAFSKAQQKTGSSGILAFECSEDPFDDHAIHFWERYEGNVALGRHNTSTQVQSFMKKVQPHLESPIGMALYEWNDGQLGAVCLQGGPKGEGGLDDATGASGAAGGAGLKQTSATLDLTNSRDKEDDSRAVWGLGNLKKLADGSFKLPWQK
uniref:ABM domain-containing protein n=2 Tax=Auxenochlorella protothecoides TaxID=3075 RepID=A0A1D2A4Y7_AUXPR